MNKGLRAYLKRIGAQPVDRKIVEEYDRDMRERTIPEIERKLRKSAALTAEMRFCPWRQRDIIRRQNQEGNERA